MSKQSRASVKYVLKWINNLDVEDVLIENVPDFMTWGPLHRVCTCGIGPDDKARHGKGCKYGTPIASRKGQFFNAFIRKLRSINYTVSYRVLNAADYGDPTTRKRLFIVARKHQPIRWPDPTHDRLGGDMFGRKPRWRPAREIIDWSLKGESIFSRKKPLSPNTLRRIRAGLMKFGGQAFVIGQQSGASPRSVDDPIPTVAAAGAISVIQPFLMTTNWTATNRSQPRSMDQPVPTVTGEGSIALVEPFILPVEGFYKGNAAKSLNEPLTTITSRGGGALVEPFIIQMDMGGRLQSINEPINTLTSADARALVQPYLVEYRGGKGAERRTRSVNEPLPTQDTSNRFALAEPYLIEYNGTGLAASVNDPLGTITGSDRFGLVEPWAIEIDGRHYLLDIRFRMLQPHELAAAMSFPKGYKFSGNRDQSVKQIGNSVPVGLSEALCRSLLQ